MPGLPAELFYAIAQHISDYPTLYALALTNRTLRYPAEMQLYSAMTNEVDAALQCKFLASVVEIPRLAEYVKEYHFYSMTNFQDNRDLWELTARGLLAMKNLKILIFREYSARPQRANLLDMDRGVTFRLEKLHWHSQSDEKGLQKVLEQQRRGLRDLSLKCTKGTTFSPIIFPRLEKLSGDLRILESFLYGSRVTHLTWNPGPHDALSLDDCLIPDIVIRARLQRMERELGVVKTFSLKCDYYRPGLGAFNELLDRMETFELTGLNQLEEIHLLKTFPSLREFVLSTWHVKEPSPISSEGRQRTMAQLFDECPKLILVDIKHDWDRRGRVLTYQRWQRGSETPIQLTNKEVMAGRFW